METGTTVHDSPNFWILCRGESKPIGPFCQHDVESLLNLERIGRDDLVYFDRLGDWMPFTDVFDIHPQSATRESQGERTGAGGSLPPSRVAVIAIHGVGNQSAGQSAARIANLLLKFGQDVRDHCPSRKNCYPAFEKIGIQIATRRVNLSALSLTKSEVVKAAGNFKGPEDLLLSERDLQSRSRLPSDLRNRLKSWHLRDALRAALHSKVHGMGCDTAWHREVFAQLEQHAGEGPKGCYETVCLKGKREHGCRRRHRPSNIDIYELHWADLSRLAEGMLSILRAVYQLVFELAWLGHHTLEELVESLRADECRTSTPANAKPSPKRPLMRFLFQSMADAQALFSLFLTTIIPMQSVLLLAMLGLLYITAALTPDFGVTATGEGIPYPSINALLVFLLSFVFITGAVLKLPVGGWAWRYWTGFICASIAAVIAYWLFAGEVLWIKLPEHLTRLTGWKQNAAGILLWLLLSLTLSSLLLLAFGQRQRTSAAKATCVILILALTVLLLLGLALRESTGGKDLPLPQPLAAAILGVAGATWLLLILWGMLTLWMMIFIIGFITIRCLLYLKQLTRSESPPVLTQLRDILWTGLISVTLPTLVTLLMNVALWHFFLLPLRDYPWPGPQRLLDAKIKLPAPAADWIFDAPWFPALDRTSLRQEEARLSAFLPWRLPDLQEPQPSAQPLPFSRLINEVTKRIIPPSVESAFVATLVFAVASFWCLLSAAVGGSGLAARHKDPYQFSRLLGKQVNQGFRGLRWSQTILTASLVAVFAGFIVAPQFSRCGEHPGPRWTDRFFLGVRNFPPAARVSPPEASPTPALALGAPITTLLQKLDGKLNGRTEPIRLRRYAEFEQIADMVHGVAVVAYCLTALVLVGSYTPVGQSARLLVEGFRAGMGAALDVVNYLRRRPLQHTVRAQVMSRFISLLRYVITKPDPSAPHRACYRRIVIVAHSQGSVIAADALKLLRPEAMARANGIDPKRMPPIRLFTLGSPLRQLYGLRLPQTFGWARPASHDPGIIDGGSLDLRDFLGVEAWWNAYCSGDYIGRFLWRSEKALHDAFVPGSTYPHDSGAFPPKLEFCLGPGAHTRYWQELAHEALEGLDRLIQHDGTPGRDAEQPETNSHAAPCGNRPCRQETEPSDASLIR